MLPDGTKQRVESGILEEHALSARGKMCADGAEQCREPFRRHFVQDRRTANQVEPRAEVHGGDVCLSEVDRQTGIRGAPSRNRKSLGGKIDRGQ